METNVNEKQNGIVSAFMVFLSLLQGSYEKAHKYEEIESDFLRFGEIQKTKMVDQDGRHSDIVA